MLNRIYSSNANLVQFDVGCREMWAEVAAVALAAVARGTDRRSNISAVSSEDGDVGV
jgi:hypothetical protein